MLRVYDCIAGQHDLRLVAVAGALCLFACYTAISLLGRARLAEGGARAVWLSGAATVAGAGIWSTHFVAMLAFRPNIPVGYDFGLTALSIAIAIGVTWCGFRIALDGGGRNAAFGGAVAGLAVASMHYAGMAAVRVPAETQWAAGYVAASILLGTVFCAAALRAADVPAPRRHLAAASLYVLGIVGLHFTAMAAVAYVPDPAIPMPAEIMSPAWLSVAVASVTGVIIAFGLAGSIVDQHLADRSAREAARLRVHVAELEATKRQLEQTTANLTVALEHAAASSQTKSQFLATMSHELRTPLNAVIGFSDLMAHEAFGPLGNPRYRDYARTICDSGAHLLGLINDVLDLSKVDAGGLEVDDGVFDLARLVDEALRMMGRQAEKAGVRLAVSLPPGLPAMRADERRMRQVLLNLLSNAVKFTPEGGTVRVSAALSAGGLSLAVADTGIGIAPEDVPTALERFGQVDSSLARRYDGTGLGLPLAKSLMELHGGALAIESAVGAGTTVTVTLPADRIAGPDSPAGCRAVA